MYNKIRIDTYYDLTCDNCARSWSTDFDYVSKKMNQLNVGGMGMAMDRNSLYHIIIWPIKRVGSAEKERRYALSVCRMWSKTMRTKFCKDGELLYTEISAELKYAEDDLMSGALTGCAASLQDILDSLTEKKRYDAGLIATATPVWTWRDKLKRFVLEKF